MTDWTEDEVTDARRDIAALLRASLDGRRDDIGAILDGAGGRGTGCIAECLTSTTVDLIVRFAAAVLMIAEAPKRELVADADGEILMERPGVRPFAEKIIARIQDEILGEG